MKFLSIEERKEFAIINLGESKTIPDTAVNIADIVEKYTQPSWDQLMRIGMYDEEMSLDTMTNAEIIEKLSSLHNMSDFSEFDDISEIRKALDSGATLSRNVQNAINAQILKNKYGSKEQKEATKTAEKTQE